ncbi:MULTISPECIES: TRAP transporter small permease [unclassified Shinella]|jgi:TRAP-type C4-dicarboxylate transport system permease small subunit|uniref:TRAP transporter small permease n=1 Tax=unclassified Shinella TaxID=2643062 RepID=UPI0003C5332A|nr:MULTISPECIES: TRAP transporter small permease [unclassified Shinella]EYR80261.1 TRAP-type transporter,small permease component [Shinella sp. DD12]MCO5148769.1 TRAP transporter small permease [Shinella sp.]MDC7264830.1 TRAP transporter small permease [Shinella sp. HY16]MDC7271727.1 TRAP transporter small permease [Shinella sp. YZ44]MDG4673456.1 TRAP transporter small permease [Shinella sp. 838]
MQDASNPPRIAAAIDRTAGAAGGLAIATFTGIIVYVVICRYAFSFTPRWSEEIPRLLLVWATFIGAISAFIRKTHLCAGLTDLIVAPGRFRVFLDRLARLASFLFLIVVFWSGWKMTSLTWSHETTVLSWPAGLVYLALPVTAVFAFVALLALELRK